MPVLRVNNYVDAYRLRAQAEDVHDLAARPDKPFVTELVNRQILDAIQPSSEDFLVDIGCGDASLVRMAGARALKCVGIAGSVEEKLRLESEFPGVSILAGQAQSLPLESRSATKIVCNGMMHYLPSEDDVKAALREMARIAIPGATIWIGEVPEINEYVHYGMYRGNSMLGYLWHLLGHNGLRAFLGMIRRWIKAVFGKERIVLNSAGMFYASPDRMRTLAKSCGLVPKAHLRSKEIDSEGKISDSKLRYDYVFTV